MRTTVRLPDDLYAQVRSTAKRGVGSSRERTWTTTPAWPTSWTTMLALDVNVLVTALRPDRRDHLAMKEWVEGAVADPEPVGVSDAVLAGAVRVPTHRRVFDPPSAVDDVLTEPSRLRGADDGDFAQFPGLVWRRTLRA